MSLLALDILHVVERLGARLRKVGSYEWAGPCPKCGGTDRFSVNTSKGVFNCRGCGVGGDAIALVRHVNGCSYREALAFLDSDDIQVPKRPLAKPKLIETDRRIAALIANIIREITPVWESPGKGYLQQTRRINVDAVADVLKRTDAIGWHPSVFFNQPDPTKPLHELHGRSFGAIIAIMSDPVTGKLTGAIARTYITADLKKLTKAKTLGSPRGIVRLSRDEDVLEGLGLAEGLETALAVMARGFRPIWSTGDKKLMAAFPVVPVIQSLRLFADNDPDGGGLRAAQEAQARWLAAGRDARVRMTEKIGDLNDVHEEDAA